MNASEKYWNRALSVVTVILADKKAPVSRISARVSMSRVAVNRYTDSPRNRMDSRPAVQGMGMVPRRDIYAGRRNRPRVTCQSELAQNDSMSASCWGMKLK